MTTEAKPIDRRVDLMPGDKLPNGAIVIALFKGEKGYCALCLWYKNAEPEYVSWWLDEQLGAYWGHYDPSFMEAVNKFKKRIL